MDAPVNSAMKYQIVTVFFSGAWNLCFISSLNVQ